MPLGEVVRMLSQYVQALAACLVDMQGTPPPPPPLPPPKTHARMMGILPESNDRGWRK